MLNFVYLKGVKFEEEAEEEEAAEEAAEEATEEEPIRREPFRERLQAGSLIKAH